MVTNAVLPPIDDRYVRFIKKITVNLRAGFPALHSVQAAASRLTRLSGTGIELEAITLAIGAAEGVSPIMNTIWDDSIIPLDHPIVAAFAHLLETGAAKVVQLRLQGAWLANGAAAQLKARFGSRLQFAATDGTVIAETDSLSQLERTSTGKTASRIALGAAVEDRFFDPAQPSPISDPGFAGLTIGDLFGADADWEGDEDEEMTDIGEEFDMADEEEFITDDETNETQEMEEDDLADIDVDLDEDLMPIDEDEFDHYADSYNEMARQQSIRREGSASVRFLINMAPELL